MAASSGAADAVARPADTSRTPCFSKVILHHRRSLRTSAAPLLRAGGTEQKSGVHHDSGLRVRAHKRSGSMPACQLT